MSGQHFSTDKKSAGSVMTKTVFYEVYIWWSAVYFLHCIDQGIKILSNQIIMVLSKTRNLLYVIHNTHVRCLGNVIIFIVYIDAVKLL